MQPLHDIVLALQSGPIWVIFWLGFMAIVFLLSLPFAFQRKEAMWIAISTLLLAPLIMVGLYHKFGFTRILGLGHILGWAPALFFALRHKRDWQNCARLGDKYIMLALGTMAVSLLFDITDVFRFLASQQR